MLFILFAVIVISYRFALQRRNLLDTGRAKVSNPNLILLTPGKRLLMEEESNLDSIARLSQGTRKRSQESAGESSNATREQSADSQNHIQDSKSRRK
jgi:hypothetical protein